METLDVNKRHESQMRAFVEHPHIRPLAERPAWTISTSDKMPIDMYLLESLGQVFGCKREIPLSTWTLDDVAALVPNAANYAFYLEAAKDGVCVLDIEPECPMELKAEFLRAPCLYAERSMSGKGFHMLLPYPYEFMDRYPVAAGKTAMKDKERGFEFLFEHWVTFTGDRVIQTDVDPGSDVIGRELARLAEEQVAVSMAEIDIEDVAPDDVPYHDQIRSYIGNNVHRILGRSPADYDGDMSRFEFAVICSILRNVRAAQSTIARMDHADPWEIWDDQCTAFLVFEAATTLLDHRDKHDEQRCGLPMLLYIVKKAMSVEAANAMEDDGNDVIYDTEGE